MMTDNAPWWVVEVNGGQKRYTLQALSALLAAEAGSDRWVTDAKPKWRKNGVYDLKVRRAKFGEIRQQVVVPVQVVE